MWWFWFKFENGLFSRSVCGFVRRVCIKVIWVCCLFDSLVGFWVLKFVRLILFNVFFVWCLCLDLDLICGGIVKVRFWIIDRWGKRSGDWNINFMCWF